MDSAARYEIVDTIATGEFATVYRARDRELGREVAIKQIHPQFLTDTRQLARYWQEAQLLASLQHPNIVTIYDVVRSRGWLVLELMRGSLKPNAEGEPIDLDYLRAVLASCLSGLQFLHAGGIIHGDVKPSNILIGSQGRVKLGDFGLARRASNDEGSLLKGTTKYMAPELLSPQFGAVGPASDLYSLGFSAYELLCGAQFDSLLPTLASFGRNKQVAWMMWHSTADVKLPDISRILEGVPDDLAHVIERLIVKDQSKRYSSALEVLRDLQGGRGVAGALAEAPDLEAEAAAEKAARQKKRRRLTAILAAACSVMLCFVIVFWPKKHLKPKAAPAGPDQGVVTHIWPDENYFAIAESKDGSAKRIDVHRGDRIFINGESRLIQELQTHDNVRIERVTDESTKKLVQEIHAFRPAMNSGRIKSVDPATRALVLGIEEGEARGKDLSINVPVDLAIRLNGLAEFDGKPVDLAALRPGDRADIHHVSEEGARRATEVEAERVVDLAGVLADDFDPKTGLLSVTTGPAENQHVVKLPFAGQFVITINGQPAAKPTALAKDDLVAIKHDTHIVELKAQRTLGAGGVIEQMHFEPPQSASVISPDGRKTTYEIGSLCKITLGGEPIAADDLRAGDVVRITHAALDSKNQDVIRAATIAATRLPDPTRWAIVVAAQNYDDKDLSPLRYSLADAKLLTDTLVKRYRVPVEQALLLEDPSGVQLTQGIPERLKAIGLDAKLIVYYVGHAYKDDQGKVWLAPKDFKSTQPDGNGFLLQSLVDQLEACPAKEKLLLLDATHTGSGADLAMEPSTSEMLRTLNLQPNRALFRTVTAVASCRKDERGLDLTSKEHGLFGWCLAEAYSGLGDANRDTRLEPGELYAYLQTSMAQASKEAQGIETPELFLPNDRPPRLNDAAKNAIRRLAGHLAQTKVDMDEARHDYDAAAQEAGKELEPRLLFGLLLVKIKDRDDAMKQFEELKSEFPDRLLPLAALTWVRFDKRSYPAGVNELVQLIDKIPKPVKAGETYTPEARYLFTWAGQLREFTSLVVADPPRPLTESLASLDSAIARHGSDASELFQKGRDQSDSVAADFDKRIAATENTDEATSKILAVQRRLLVHYADFPFDKYGQQILSHLDD